MWGARLHLRASRLGDDGPLDLPFRRRTRRDPTLVRGAVGGRGDRRAERRHGRRADLHRYLGAVAIFSGDVDKALAHFERGRVALAPYLEDYPDLRPRANALAEVIGIAHLRRGETENCLVNPGTDRCLFPLRQGGVHHQMAGARSAFGG